MKEEKNTALVPVKTDEQELILMENSSNDTSSEILFEDTTKRSENVKHFRMKNGHYMAAVYDKPVHTFNKVTGKFVDIAHRFDEKEECFEAETDRFKARFPKKEGKRKFVTVEKDGRSVSWRFIPATNSHKKHAVAAVHQHERASLMELPRFPQLKYEKTKGQIDLEYGITEQGVKENIILAKRPKHSTFRFELKLDGLRAVLSEDKKSIRLFAEDMETDEPEFIIPPVNMTDAAGVYSEAAYYELVVDENNTVMEIVIDPEWLLAEERLYPVIVDPQVVANNKAQVSSFTEFFTLSEESGVLENGAAYMAGFNSNGKEYRTYLKYNYPVLPDGYNVTTATLNLHQHSYVGSATYSLHEIREDWSKGSLTWRNQPEYGSALASVHSVERSSSETIKLDITNDVKSWYAYERDNYGFMIKSCSCAECCCANHEQYLAVHNCNSANGYAPMVEISYTLVDEYADHQKHESFSAGRAGSGAVNLFTGKLFFTHNDVTASGGKLPLSLSHVYRSDYADLDYTESTYGKGWIISAAQTLTLDDSEEVYAIYRDAQGRKHYFTDERFVNDTDVVYDDSTGLGLTFDGEHTVTDEKGNSLIFTDGKLTEIKDANGNKMSLEYDDDERLEKITDSIGRTVTLTYNSSGKLASIKDMKNRNTTFTYVGDNLTKITYPDASITEFSYVSGTSRLTKVTDQSGISYEINYTNAQVTALSRKGNKTVARNDVSTISTTKDGGGIDILYRNASTVVEDKWTRIRAVYRFDGSGRVIGSYEDLTQNTSLDKGEITITDLSEYAAVLNRKTGTVTNGRYATVKAGISGTSVMHPNYLTNGNFESGTTGWSIIGSGSGSVVEASSYMGSNSYCFSGSATQRLEQTVTFESDEVNGNVLVVSAWAKSDMPTGTFKLYAKLTCTDNTVVEREANFDSGCTDWQYAAVPLEIDLDKVPQTVLVRFDCTDSSTCYVSNIRLTETRGVYTRVRENTALHEKPKTNNGTGEFLPETILGKDIVYERIVYSTNGITATKTFYSTNSDAVKTISYNEENYPYYSYAAYDNKHQPTKTRDYRGLVNEFTYDSFGSVASQKTYHKDDTATFLYSRADHSSETGRLTFAHDPRYAGIGTSYSYDDACDLMTQRIDPNGQVFRYAHDEDTDRQTSVTAIDADCGINDIANNFAYDLNYLTQVTHNGFNFNFEYEPLGRNSKIKAGGNTLVSFTYVDGEENSVTSSYANGYQSVVTNDSRGNPKTKTISGSEISTAEYDELGNVTKLIDKIRNVCYTYTYNKNGKLTRVDETRLDDGSLLGYQVYSYDTKHRFVKSYDSRTTFTYYPEYEKVGDQNYPDHATKGIRLNGKYTDEIERDGLRRTTARKLTLYPATTPFMTDTYGYLGGYSNSTTGFVSALTHTVGGTSTTYNYTYDNVGNIETVKKGSNILVKYTYDGLNRLTQEDNYEFGKRYTYTYDHGGNITAKKVYALSSTGAVIGDATTYSYTYDSTWKDKLRSFNGQTISYDGLGNPTTYRDNTLTWTRVRRLARYGSNTFEYNASGIRTKKNNITYTLDGNKILRETDGTKTLTYYYGNSGVIGFNYNGTNYFYEKNLQGDVTAIYNTSGTKVASYTYDAWGKNLTVTNHTSANIGSINPFRYRSYYYDVETGLYYLQTRYYDPEVGRFINSDAYEYLGDGAELSNYNLFAYCGNNPVNCEDPEGTTRKYYPWDELKYPGEIHKAVQRDILKNYPDAEMEVNYIDILLKINSILYMYEVKPFSYRNLERFRLVWEQISRYASKPPYADTGTQIIKGSFTHVGEKSGYTYYVNYVSFEGAEWLVLYSFYRDSNDSGDQVNVEQYQQANVPVPPVRKNNSVSLGVPVTQMRLSAATIALAFVMTGSPIRYMGPGGEVVKISFGPVKAY
jgi:RHS repeat-associated protein